MTRKTASPPLLPLPIDTNDLNQQKQVSHKTSRVCGGWRGEEDSCSLPPPPGYGLVATVTHTEGGGSGWVRGQKKVCLPKIDLQFRAPLINPIFLLRNNFLMWVGGSRAGSGGAQAAIPLPPTPPPGNGKPWPAPSPSPFVKADCGYTQ